jgi:hypothetical protein
LGEDYLSYPKVNEPFDFTFCHEFDGPKGEYNCHEWEERIVVRISVEAVE